LYLCFSSHITIVSFFPKFFEDYELWYSAKLVGFDPKQNLYRIVYDDDGDYEDLYESDLTELLLRMESHEDEETVDRPQQQQQSVNGEKDSTKKSAQSKNSRTLNRIKEQTKGEQKVVKRLANARKCSVKTTWGKKQTNGLMNRRKAPLKTQTKKGQMHRSK
jgi:hypothetical protein